jgi:hypothetical protein
MTSETTKRPLTSGNAAPSPKRQDQTNGTSSLTAIANPFSPAQVYVVTEHSSGSGDLLSSTDLSWENSKILAVYTSLADANARALGEVDDGCGPKNWTYWTRRSLRGLSEEEKSQAEEEDEEDEEDDDENEEEAGGDVTRRMEQSVDAAGCVSWELTTEGEEDTTFGVTVTCHKLLPPGSEKMPPHVRVSDREGSY